MRYHWGWDKENHVRNIRASQHKTNCDLSMKPNLALTRVGTFISGNATPCRKGSSSLEVRSQDRLGLLSRTWLWDLYCCMAGIAWGLCSTHFVSALWSSLWMSRSLMHSPPHVRLGPGECRERLFRESLCFTWPLASNCHAPQSLLAWGDVGSHSGDP